MPEVPWCTDTTSCPCVLYIIMPSLLLRFICFCYLHPNITFLFTKSFRASRLWHHLSFSKQWLFWIQYSVHSAEVLLISPRWKHYWVMCRDLKTKSGPEVAWDYSWGEFFSFVFVPAYSHWMPLKSLTENLGQHIAWGHLNFKSAAIFLLLANGREKGLSLQLVSWSWNLAQETSSQSQTYLCSAGGSVSRRLMSLNWHAVFWVRAELELGLNTVMRISFTDFVALWYRGLSVFFCNHGPCYCGPTEMICEQNSDSMICLNQSSGRDKMLRVCRPPWPAQNPHTTVMSHLLITIGWCLSALFMGAAVILSLLRLLALKTESKDSFFIFMS